MPRPKSDIEPRILHAARARFLTEGVDGASLRNIARDAHTSIGMVYYYFPTKDDLFLAVVEEVYGQLIEDFARAVDVPAGFEERLRRLFVRFGQATDDEITVLRLVMREALGSTARLGRVFERFQRGHIALLFGMVQQGIAEGALDEKNHPVVMMMCLLGVGGVPQMIRRHVGDRPPISFAPGGEELSHRLADILLHGLARRAPGAAVPESREIRSGEKS